MKKLNKKVFFMAAFLLYIVAAVAFNTLPKKDSPKALSGRYNDAYSAYKKRFPSSLSMPGVQAGANSMKLLVKDKFSILGLLTTATSYQDPGKHLEIPSQYVKPITATRDGYWIRFTPNFSGKMNNVTAEVTGTALVYPQVMKDLDIIQHLMPNGIKEDMILKSKNAPSTYTWTMEYDPRLTPTLENNIVSFYTKAPAPQPTSAENGNRHVQMTSEFIPEKKFEISPPYLMDTKGALHMKVQTAMTTHSLTFTIEKAWLEREATYPLLLDPTILYNTSASFGTGAFNMAVDEGSGTSPSITSARHELTADASTVLLYHMNEGTATSLTDSSGNNYTAGVAGTTVVASGVGPKLGNARSFNGTSDNTGTSNPNQDLSKDLTIEFWIYPTNIGTNRLNPIYKSYGGEFGMTIETGGNMSYYQGYGTGGGQYYGGTLLPVGSLTNGKWYHVAIVRKGVTVAGYVNGTLVNTLVTTIAPVQTSSQINIAYGYTGAFMGGTYDEVRIMTRAASNDEIARDAGRYPNSVWTSPSIDLTSALSWSYLSWIAKGVASGDGETPQSTAGLVAEWKFNETSGTTASNSIAAVADSWSTGTAGGTARSGSVGVAYNGKIYYWGGTASGGTYLNTMDIYDIAGNSWSTGATGGTARSGHAGALYNGKIYYWGGLGTGGAYVNSVDIYDIAGNAWSIGNTGGTIRYNHSGVAYNGKIYSWGGANGTGNLNTTDIYDIANNTWSTGAAGGTARNGHVGVLYAGKFYNWGGSSGGVNVNTMDIYDIAANSWSTGAAGGTARFLSAGDGYNGRLYFWGGFSGSYPNTVDVYDIAGNSWSTTTAGGTGRYGHTGSLYSNKLYFWGGGNPSPLNTMDIFIIGSSGCGATCNGTLYNFINTTGQDIYSQEVESGGTISYVGGDVVHTFTSGGTLTLSRPKESLQALIVAGGGGGGVGQTTAYEAGGGGGGGVIYNDDWRMGVGSYGVAVGTGGTNANGGNSSFGGYTAIGGGKGGNGAAAGVAGGSGGGGSHPSTPGGAGTAGQGYNGGNGGSSVAGGGGGGGEVGNTNCQGCGGDGYASYITGATSATYYGGGGGAYPGVSGGAGGGGASTTTLNGAVTSGAANTGGGGAGSYCSTGTCTAGSGGSGIVIVRYPSLNPSGWTSVSRRWGAGAINFDGESDYVKVPDSSYLDATTGVTIAAWINGRQFDAADFTHLVDKDGSYSLSVYYGKPAMYLTAGGWWTPSTAPLLQTGKWYYLVATYNGSYKRIYVNGVKVAEAAQSGAITPSALPLGIGGRQDGTILFNGTIDAVSIYNRGMTDAEVLSNYNAGQVEIQTRTSADNANWEAWRPTTGETQISSMDAPHLYNTTDAGLISYWPMDETSGTTVADVKSGYNGTAVGGMPIIDGVFGKGRMNNSGQYVTVPSNSSLNITGSFTISAWVRGDYLYGSYGYNNLYYGVIASKTSVNTSTAGGYGLYGYYGSVYCRTSNGATYTDSYANSPGSYGINGDLMHIVAVYNSGSGSCRIYINGVDRTASDPVHVAPSANSLPLNIGIQGDLNGWGTSAFDEVRLYNTPLSLAQVQDLYAKGLTSTNGYRMAPDTSLKTEGTASLRLATANTLNDTDMISSWHMDETGTSLMDTSGNGYNGTAVGTTVVKGISGNGRSFNGSTDYVSIPGPSYTGLPLSIEAWIYSNGIQGTYETIFKQNENATNYYGAWLQILANNGLELGYGNGGVAGPASRRSLQTGNYVIPANQWVHVAGVIRGETDMMIYVNGTRIGGTYSGTGNYYQKSNDPGSIGKTFNGRIDEVRFSNHARTQAEILESYQLSSDNYFTLPLSSTDLSNKTTLPFSIAADRPGTYLQTIAGESAFANYVPDGNTIGFWHFDEPVASSYLVQRDVYYGYNGTEQTGLVPFGTFRVFVKAWGGGGGGGGSTTAGATGGGGGFASGYVYNNVSYSGGNYTTIEVGGGGQNGTTCVTGTGGGAGGYGSTYYGAGGARGGNAGTVGCSSGGGGGGGPSWNYLDSWMGALWDVVAGGGGGGAGGESAIGGAGGTGGQNGATGYCSGTGGTTNRGDYIMDGGQGGDRGGADGSGGGGGGGGAYGGWGGLAPTCDSQGGGGGAGGYNMAGTGGTTATGSNQQPANYTDPDRTIGAAIGGWRQSAGSAGRLAIEQVNEPGIVYDLKDSSGYGNHAYASATTGGKVGAPVVYGYNGGWQTYVVPNGVTRIAVKGWGGGGGAGGGGAYGATGGGGAYAASTIPVVPGETLYISVGGGGTVGASNVTGTGGGAGGGGAYGPGARGGNTGTTGASNAGGGGGAGTFILRDANVIVYAAAGGGGGSGAEAGGQAGAGGGGGQNGYAGSVAGGTTGAVWYAATGTTADKGAGDGSAGGGGGGGQFGGSAGAAPTVDSVGGGGGAGGSSYGDSIANGYATTPGNSGDAERTGNAGGGAALGGNGAAGLLIIRPVELASNKGILGNARYFNLASTDAVTFPAITLNVPYTIDAWVQFPIPLSANWRTLFARNGGTYHYALVQAGSNNLGVYNSGFYPCGWDPTSVSGWHHFALVAAGDGYTQFYLDGHRICRSATQISGQPIGAIGNYSQNGTQGVGTSMDEVRISNTARSQDDLRQAFEIGARSHNVTIDFAARLSGDLITGSADYSFTVNGTGYGLQNPASNLYVGDKIIAREIIGSTTYVAQGSVTAVNTGSGAVTVSSWDAGSTFPPSGFSANADIFKWQREYWNITQPLDTHVNTTSFLTMKILNGAEGRNIWIDDLRSNTNYIAQSAPTSFDPLTGTGIYTVAPGVTSTLNRYFQYRIINSSNDDAVAPQVTSTVLDYESNNRPTAPVITAPANGATGVSITPAIQLSSTDTEGNYLRYKIQIATDVNFTQNVQTFDETQSQTGWSGQNTQSNTAYTSGTTATYTVQTPLTGSTTYYIRAYAVDQGGSKQWSNVSTVVSFTTNTKPNAPVISAPLNGAVSQPLTPVIQLAATDTEGNYLRYRIQIATDAGFSSIVQTIDQTLSQTGWTGQDDQGGTAYTSGTTATYTVQTPLTGNTTYYIRAYAIDQGGSNGWSVASSTVSFTTNYKPNAPVISGPANGSTGVLLAPSVMLAATDTEGNYLRYKIQIATDAGFSQNLQTFDGTLTQTGWSGQDTQGGTAYTSGTTATYTLQSSLNDGTVYYIRAYAIDQGGSQLWSNASATVSFTTNYKPNAPTITVPFNGATGVSLNPAVQMNATDPNTDFLRYKFQIATDAGFGGIVETGDETSSQTGWSGQNAQSNTAYNSGSTATYTIQSVLVPATTYYIRAYAIDPGGSALFSNPSSTVSFTTGSLGSPTPCSASLVGNVGPIRVDWTDNSVVELNYLVELSINSGAWNQISSLPANTVSQSYGSLNPLTSYQYRIRAQAAGNQYSGYCTTNTVTTFTYGDLLFEKVMFENMKLD